MAMQPLPQNDEGRAIEMNIDDEEEVEAQDNAVRVCPVCQEQLPGSAVVCTACGFVWSGGSAVNATTDGLTLQTIRNVPLEFYRKHLLRGALAVAIVSIPCLFFVPIVGFLMLPTSVLLIYWLYNTIRFHHGGDLSRCSNRDCGIMFYFLSGCLCLVVALFDVFLAAMQTRSASASNSGSTAEPHAGRSGKTHTHSIGFLVCDIILDLVMIVLLFYTLFFLRKLRLALAGNSGATTSSTLSSISGIWR